MVTFESTDIVVASAELDAGKANVVETWRGDAAPGTPLLLADLAAVSSESRRTVLIHDRATRLVVEADRMVLFLKKNPDGTLGLTRRAIYSVVFLHGSQAYAPSLPGSYEGLGSLGLDETCLHGHVAEAGAFAAELAQAHKIEDRAQRAEALVPLVTSSSPLRGEALSELRSCGKAAVPTLRRLIAKRSLRSLRGELLALFEEVSAADAVQDVTALLVEEVRFWRASARSLEDSWWQGSGIESGDELGELLERLGVARVALAFADRNDGDAMKKAAADLRALWQSEPAYKPVPSLLGLPEESVAAR